jgi:hypothetical protein
MLCGNHEDCARAGAGWFYFLDLSDTVPQRGCSPDASDYVLHFDGLDLAVLDTAQREQPGELLTILRQAIASGLSAANTVPLLMSGDTHLFGSIEFRNG